jgi:hypothetical protein
MPAQTFTTGQILTAAQMNALSTQAYANSAAPAPEVIVPTSGQSITLSSSGALWHQLRPAAPLATLTITMPATPADQAAHEISSTQSILSATVLANAGQSLQGAPGAIAQNATLSWRFDLASSTWVRLF